MQNEWQEMTIENCGDGKLKDAFENGLATMLADLNADGKVSTDRRTLTMKVSINGVKGDDDFLKIHISSDVALAKTQPLPSNFAMKNAEGGITQKIDVQEDLPLVDNVTPINEEVAGE